MQNVLIIYQRARPQRRAHQKFSSNMAAVLSAGDNNHNTACYVHSTYLVHTGYRSRYSTGTNLIFNWYIQGSKPGI